MPDWIPQAIVCSGVGLALFVMIVSAINQSKKEKNDGE